MVKVVVQAFFLALFGWMSSFEVPYTGHALFKWVFDSPIASGLVCGIILGDVKAGVLMGCAIQVIFLTNLVVGSSMTVDVNFVSYICIPLALVSGASTELAMAMAIPISMLGVLVFTFYNGICSVFYQAGDRAIEQNDIKKMKRIYGIYPSIFHVPLRFGIPFVTFIVGAQYAENLIQAIPAVVLRMGEVVGGILPAIGMAILLAYTLKEIKMVVFYLIGLIAVTYMNFNTVTVAVLGGCLAVMYYMFTGSKKAEAAFADGEEDDL